MQKFRSAIDREEIKARLFYSNKIPGAKLLNHFNEFCFSKFLGKVGLLPDAEHPAEYVGPVVGMISHYMKS